MSLRTHVHRPRRLTDRFLGELAVALLSLFLFALAVARHLILGSNR